MTEHEIDRYYRQHDVAKRDREIAALRAENERLRKELDANNDACGDALGCPAAEHLRALGQEPWTCVAGLSTNAQGAVPLSRCKHLLGDLRPKGRGLVADCDFVPEPAQEEA